MTQETQSEHPDPLEPKDEDAAGTAEDGGDEGPDPSELDKDPAYEPPDGLKDLKGG